MILDSIVINNFGVYAGKQEILLTPAMANKPIILFGGMNGAGKTTLLDAIQLAFYGPHARCSNRGKLSYRDYLRDAISRGVNAREGASIEVRFRRAVDGRMCNYRVVRSWHENGSGIQDDLEVTRDDELGLLDSDYWNDYIEAHIPSGIAHLFFFDAEQIKELADGEHASEILGTAIRSLLGLDLVDRLRTDLIVLERRKKAESKEDEGAKKLRHAEEEFRRLEDLHVEATQHLGKLNNDVEQEAKKVAATEKRFRKEGGELFERRKELEERKEMLGKELAAKISTLREIAAGAAPLLLISNLLGEAEKQARQEIGARKAEMVLSVLEERDENMLKLLRSDKLSPTHVSRVEKVLREDRESRQKLLVGSGLLAADDHLAAELKHCRVSILPEIAKRIEAELAAVLLLREQHERLDAELGRVPPVELIAGLQRELKTARNCLREKVAAVDAQKAKTEALARQLELARNAYENATGGTYSSEDQERILKHSVKVRNTLENFRAAVIRKHVEKIERLVLESFIQLLRKENLVSALRIDPETYRIELSGGDGKTMPMERLSAGERQLLATSLLWGLAKASGQPLPTIIDTPLGRLDSSHRRHLVDRYFPVASHQVILLSTDEEIDEESLDRLKPHIGRSYRLDFNDATRTTTVQPGYFWNHEATP